MTDDVIVGIDLGTTFSAVAAVNRHGKPQVLPNAEGARTTPSVVYFEDGGQVVVGAVARNQALAEPDRTVQFIKRKMGDPSFHLNIDGTEYVPEAISGLILKKLCADAAARLGQDVRRAVISVPAYFKDSQRTATQKAGEIAGLDVVAIINEPTAAAIAYGLARPDEHRNVLVYDFGGGTFDVTILRIDGNEFTVLATDGDANLGGIDIDELVADYLAERFLEQQGADLRDDPLTRLDLFQRAERAKIDLSSRQSVSVILSAGAATMRVDLGRERLAELTAPLLERTRACMESAVAAAKLEWPAIDALLLVGGSSRMVAVRELARAITGKDPAVDVNPDECVALGAALRAHLADVAERTDGPTVPGQEAFPAEPGETMPVIRDVAPHSLGVRALSPEGKPVNSIIIPRLTIVPCERVRTYATRVDDQNVIEIEVLQGEALDPFSPEIEPIGRVRVDELPPRPAGEVVIAVTLRYDGDGVVEVRAEELIEGRIVRQQLLRKSGELDEDLISQLKDRVEELSASGTDLSLEDPTPPKTEAEPPPSEPEPAAEEPELPPSDAAPQSDNGDLYSLLCVPAEADASEIAAALERERDSWSRRTVNAPRPEDRQEAEARLGALDDAGRILLDPAARAEYDELRRPAGRESSGLPNPEEDQ